jgi:hypothetical protein
MEQASFLAIPDRFVRGVIDAGSVGQQNESGESSGSSPGAGVERAQAQAEVKLTRVISSHMALQRDRALLITVAILNTSNVAPELSHEPASAEPCRLPVVA